MITYKKNDLFQAIWHFHTSPSAISLFKRLLWVAVYVVGITLAELWFVDLRLKNTPTEFLSALGILLSLLLIFRTNTAYGRYYEGRRAWGVLVNNSRNLAAYLNSLLPADRPEDRLFYTKMIANSAFSLENHLRSDEKSDGLEIIGEEIQEPFGLEPNNLPLNQLAQTIRLNVHELMQYYLPHEEKQAAKSNFVLVN